MTSKQAKQRELNAIKSENAQKEEVSFGKAMEEIGVYLKRIGSELEEVSKFINKVALDAKRQEKENG